MNRRTFLATPVVFGLDALAGCSGGQAEDALVAGLARMKETGRFGLVVVAPESEDDRKLLGQHLHRLIEKAPAEARGLLASVVLIGLPRDLATRRLRKDLPRNALVLLSPEGTWLDASGYDPRADIPESARRKDLQEPPRVLLQSIEKLLADRLEARAAEIEKSLAPDVKAALDALEKSRDEDAIQLLSGQVDRLGPVLARRAATADAPARSRYRAVVEAGWSAAPADRPGLRLPYGVTVEPGSVDLIDPCETCGLGGPYRVTVNGKLFRFLPG